MIIEKHIQISNPDLSVVKTLQTEIELSAIQIKQAISKGCLWLQKGSKVRRIRRLKTALQTGQELHFYYDKKYLNNDH